MFSKITTNLVVASVDEALDFYEDLHTTFYGAEEFYIRDGNGYVLTFARR